MSFFSLKISRPEDAPLVQEIKSGSQAFTVENLCFFADKLTLGCFVFIQLRGDMVPWDKGLIGLAEVVCEPHDIGYDSHNPRCYKVGLSMRLVLNQAMPREAFIPYADAYNTNAIGPSTRGEQNQALTILSDNQAYAVLRAIADNQHEAADNIRSVFSQEICDCVFGEMTYLVKKSMTYQQYLESENSN